jgi:hypothetical protein
MPEILLNLHMHTTYSDGSGSHADIAQAALQCGIDAVIVTDHNVYVSGVEGYRQEGKRRVLLIMGEEVHNQARDPQKSHTLVFGANKEMATFGSDPQKLIDQVRKLGGLSFIAHPVDPPLAMFGEDDISWVDWEVRGFTGLELWNGFSEFKRAIHSRLEAFFYAFFPQYYPQGPLPEALKRWDELLVARREKIVAIGGSDAHALLKSVGPIHRTIFPYTYHFQAVNTHLLIERDFTYEDFNADKELVLDAMRQGHAFIGYDLPSPTRGFRFTAQSSQGTVSMGDAIRLGSGVTLQVKMPLRTECRLIKDGQVIKTWTDRDLCTHISNQPGVYRIECLIDYLGKKRGWIYSNPIYVRE